MRRRLLTFSLPILVTAVTYRRCIEPLATILRCSTRTVAAGRTRAHASPEHDADLAHGRKLAFHQSMLKRQRWRETGQVSELFVRERPDLITCRKRTDRRCGAATSTTSIPRSRRRL